MRIFNQSILLLAMGVFFLASCNSSKGLVTEKNYDSLEELPHSLLWEVTGNGLKDPSYIFGTIHMIEEEEFFWPSNTLTAIDKSVRVVFEIDMNVMSDMSKMAGLMDQLYMEGDTTLKDLYTEEEFQFVSDYFNEKGIPLMLVGKMKPLFLSALVGTDAQPGSMGQGIESYEMSIQKIANSSLKPISGLEEIQDQLDFISQIPNSAQAQMLYESIKSLDEGVNQMDELVEMYKSQNISAMVATVAEEQNMMKYADILLNNRNKDWIPKIEKLIQEKPTFIAVGAGHLGGDEGVIKLMARQGYKLRPLSEVKE